jgi:hypothetical protein
MKNGTENGTLLERFDFSVIQWGSRAYEAAILH